MRSTADTPHFTSKDCNVLDEAARLVNGDRQSTYGNFGDNADKVASAFHALTGISLKKHHVPLLMVLVKMVREENCPHSDNRVDMAGYIDLWDRYCV